MVYMYVNKTIDFQEGTSFYNTANIFMPGIT